ncbi:hypothetical protein LJC63_10060 [Ruminococcaceae bacterium OttesenSCG-928-L11]|nr:hypothetical protein [Ruminococcaceae bacterium OttesenSCG-928-L11]
MKGKPNSNWIDNNKVVMVLSVCVAFLVWIVVALVVDTQTREPFHNVPVDISVQTDEFDALGLNPIDVSVDKVKAVVEGDRVAVKGLKPSDLAATVQISADVSEPAYYTLKLVPINTFDRTTITNITYEPAEVTVRLDRLSTHTFDIEAVKNGISYAPGYRGSDSESITPSQVRIRGPQAELDKISRVAITVEIEEALSKNLVKDLPVQVLDAAGDEIDLEARHLSIDYTEARFVKETLQLSGLEMRVEFTNIPRNFPIENLQYTLSTDLLEVAAPIDLVEKVKELVVGYIDVRTISRDNYQFTFPIEVPSGFQNTEKVDSVSVRFNRVPWEEANFTVSGIDLQNIPAGYDIQLVGSDTMEVRMVGEKSIISELTADDIILYVDFSEREIVEGQSLVPVRVAAPTKGLVWAAGTDYNVVIETTEAAPEEEQQ